MKERMFLKKVFKKRKLKKENCFLLYKEQVIHFKNVCCKKVWSHFHLFISVKIVYIGKKNKKLLIGKKGQFLWSLFLPLSALCALSTPLSFSERNGPTIEILLIIEETKSWKRKYGFLFVLVSAPQKKSSFYFWIKPHKKIWSAVQFVYKDGSILLFGFMCKNV